MSTDSAFSNYAGGAGEPGPAGPTGATGPAGPAGALEILTDVDAYTTQQWPGPFPVIGGIGAPTSGTGTTGDYYIDGTNPAIGVLYGPKGGDGSWPLIGNQNTVWVAGTSDPVDSAGHSNGFYYLKFSITPPTTINLLSIWGPYTNTGVGERSYLGYDQATRTWKATSGEYLLATEGGAARAAVTSVTGNFGFNPGLFSYYEHTLTGNVNYNSFTPPINPPRFTSSESRASHLVVALKQGGSGNYTVTWPSSVTWPGGSVPILSTRVGDVDLFHLISYDRGTTWHGMQIASGAGQTRIERLSTKTGDYTFGRIDINNTVVLDSTSNFTFTIPTNATMPVPNGATIRVATANTGHLTIAGAVGVTVTGSTILNTAGEIATIIKIGTNSWLTHH